ncbi:hypothetical protein M5J20_09370, partial [Corynebacterium sp. TA-R-1]
VHPEPGSNSPQKTPTQHGCHVSEETGREKPNTQPKQPTTHHQTPNRCFTVVRVLAKNVFQKLLQTTNPTIRRGKTWGWPKNLQKNDANQS